MCEDSRPVRVRGNFLPVRYHGHSYPRVFACPSVIPSVALPAEWSRVTGWGRLAPFGRPRSGARHRSSYEAQRRIRSCRRASNHRPNDWEGTNTALPKPGLTEQFRPPCWRPCRADVFLKDGQLSRVVSGHFCFASFRQAGVSCSRAESDFLRGLGRGRQFVHFAVADTHNREDRTCAV